MASNLAETTPVGDEDKDNRALEREAHVTGEEGEAVPSSDRSRSIFVFADATSLKRRAGYDVMHFMHLVALATSTRGALFQDERHGKVWCTSEQQLELVGDSDLTLAEGVLGDDDDDASDIPTDMYVILVGDQNPMANAPISFEDLTVTTLRNIAFQCSALMMTGDFTVKFICLLPMVGECERFIANGCDLDPGLPDSLEQLTIDVQAPPEDALPSPPRPGVPEGADSDTSSSSSSSSATASTSKKARYRQNKRRRLREAKERAAAEEARKLKEAESKEEASMIVELYNNLVDTRMSAPKSPHLGDEDGEDVAQTHHEDVAYYKPRLVGRLMRPNLSHEIHVLNSHRSPTHDIVIVFVDDDEVGFKWSSFQTV